MLCSIYAREHPPSTVATTMGIAERLNEVRSILRERLLYCGELGVYVLAGFERYTGRVSDPSADPMGDWYGRNE